MSNELIENLRNHPKATGWMQAAADALEAQETVIKDMAELLEGAESGFISGSGPDRVWCRLRDEAVQALTP